MQGRSSPAVSLKTLLLPKNNLWLRRATLVFAFICFDYLATLLFCHYPYEESNLWARAFMENLGIPIGLTTFVLILNFPIYVTLNVDSHFVRLPSRLARVFETSIDGLFGWFVAGVHFSGGTSWFWQAPDFARQALGAVLYLIFVILIVKPQKPTYD